MEEDLIDPSFLIGLIIKFLGQKEPQPDARRGDGDDDEEPSETEQEKAGSLIWDLSASQVHARKFCDHQIVGICHRLLSLPQVSPRVKEIAAGMC